MGSSWVVPSGIGWGTAGASVVLLQPRVSSPEEFNLHLIKMFMNRAVDHKMVNCCDFKYVLGEIIWKNV